MDYHNVIPTCQNHFESAYSTNYGGLVLYCIRYFPTKTWLKGVFFCFVFFLVFVVAYLKKMETKKLEINVNSVKY